MTAIVLEQQDSRVQSLTLVSSAAGFFFAFRIMAVVIAVRLFGADPQVGVGISLGLNYILLLLVLFLSFGPGTRKLSWFWSVQSFRWSFAFLAFSGCSLLWTVSASLAAAAAFWCAMGCDFAVVVLLLRIGSIDDVVEAVMSGYVWGSCFIAAIAWILPSQSDLRLGDEDYLGPNQIGYACAFAFFFAQYLIRRGGRGFRGRMAFLAVTLLRSLSKTTLIAFIAGQLLVLLGDRSISRRTRVLMILSAAAIIAGFWGLLSAYYDVYTHAGNQSETLTGRIGIWAYILSEAVQRPWLGHGFHSVWKVIPPFGPFEARHAHNELLQQFYAYGAVGVALLAAIYGSVTREIRHLVSSPIKTIFLSLLLFVLIRGLADTEVFDLSLPLWTIVLIGSVMGDEGAEVPVCSRPARLSRMEGQLE
jgi:exopolysaccharide production protein ExoQ